jgi:mono/diheme cytochrome c family protein
VNRAQKEAYKRDYAAAKADGKPFFPYAVYKDLIVATVVVGIIIALAIWAKSEIGPEIDVTTEDYVPRPEWYFFFLFELLKIFKNQDAFRPMIMATFVIPNVLLGLLVLWPFLDRGPERRIQKRPVSIMVGVAVIAFMGFMTYKGATSPEGVATATLPIEVPESDENALAGKQIVETGGCLTCHMIAGIGGTVGPDLTQEGTRGRGIEWQIDHLKDPASRVPGSSMPPQAFPEEIQYQQVAEFLEGLGTKYTP